MNPIEWLRVYSYTRSHSLFQDGYGLPVVVFVLQAAHGQLLPSEIGEI